MSTLEKAEKEEYHLKDNVFVQPKPIFLSTKTAICLSSSEEYAPFASLVLKSLAEHSSKNHKYDIVILTTDMLWKTQHILLNTLSPFKNISLRFVYINSFVDNLSFFTWAHFTKNTYFRLLIPDIFSTYEKVLYLDSDMIICQDIAPLLQTNLDGFYLGAALDTHVVAYCTQKTHDSYEYNKHILGLSDPSVYFQMGASLFNIKKINEDFPPFYLINLTQKYSFKWLDQDILNKIFVGKIKQLSNKWNVMIANSYPRLDEYFLPKKLRAEYMKARQEPGIIHYVGRGMPCFKKRADLSVPWWEVARKSPFYEYFLARQSYYCASWYFCENHLSQQLNIRLWFSYEWYRILSHICFWGKRRYYKTKKWQFRQRLKGK